MIKCLSVSLMCFCLCLNGCSFFSASRRKDIHEAGTPAPHFVMIQEGRLQQGGLLFVKPFIPGEEVVSSDEFDRIAMFIAQGFLTELKQSRTPFTLVDPAQASQSELLVEGRVVEQGCRRVFQKWFRRQDVKILKVEGTISDRSHNSVVLYFSHELKTKSPQEDFYELARHIGHDIGRYVVSLAEK